VRTVLRGSAVVLLAALAARQPAGAAAERDTAFFPSATLPDAAALQAVLSDHASPIKTVVVRRGAPLLTAPLLVERDDFLLRGTSGNPSLSVLASESAEAVVLRGARRVTVRDLTIRSTAPAGIALSLSAVPSPVQRSFVEDAFVDHCVLEGATALGTTVGVDGLTVRRCLLRVARPGGRGLVWQDGRGLFVAGCRFVVARGVAAATAVEVRGAQDPEAEGRRAEKIVLEGNRVLGDFATGLDLGDVVDVRVLGNRIRFPQPLRGNGEGRVGIALRRRAASSPPEDYEVFRNALRGIHTGLWLTDPGDDGWIQSNDFRGCGSTAADTRFHDEGGAIRLELATTLCPRLRIRFNDFRGLRSPRSVPAALVLPAGSEGACFSSDVDANLVDPGRELFLGAGGQ
jgi:hypothetical protein